jgi:hypothetical protein
MQPELLNPQKKTEMNLSQRHLKPLVEKQINHEAFFQQYLETLFGMPPGQKRKAMARSKRRAHLLTALNELI